MSEKSAASFERQLERLQKITNSLEREELGLDKSLALYKEGMETVRKCRQALEQARLKLRVYTENGLEDFAENDDNSTNEG